MEIHRHHLQTFVFNDTLAYFKFVEHNLKGSLDVTSLIFDNPHRMITQVC